MRCREFLGAAAAGSAGLLAESPLMGQEHAAHQAAGRIYSSPAEAMASPREELAFVVGPYAGTKVQQPDFLASVDLDPASRTYG
jgi:selenium binding protein SBP56